MATESGSMDQAVVEPFLADEELPLDGMLEDVGFVLETDEPIEPGSVELVAADPTDSEAPVDPPEGAGSTDRSVAMRSSAAATDQQPVTWAACGVTTADGKVVRTFTNRYRASDAGRFLRGGSSVLFCGNAAYGYRHIKARHQQDFENLTFLTNENWRELADKMIAGVLWDPDDTSYLATNNTFTYCRMYHLVNKRDRKIVARSFPRVVVSASDAKIITTFPRSVVCPSSW